MPNETDFTVAIIGAGFSGTLVAGNLARQTNGPRVRVLLVERGHTPGLGAAYSTRYASHLLNVRASNMSAFADEPAHFLAWARRRDPELTGDEYLPRSLYGEYLRSILDGARGEQGRAELEIVSGDAVDVEVGSDGSGAVVTLDGGRTLRTDCVVLAPGNFEPSVPAAVARGMGSSERLVRDPWRFEQLANFDRDEPILLLGTGLTLADVVLALGELGHTGPLHAVSRHGLLPIVHAAPAPPAPFDLDELDTRSVRAILRRVRSEADRAERDGAGWRASFDALRPLTQELWRGLPFDERRRFLRHASRYWDVHRHRIAPSIAEQIDERLRSGRLTVRAGRVFACCDTGSGVDVSIRERGTGTVSQLRVGRVVNCTGPGSDFRRIDDALVRRLKDRGLITPDPLGLGIEVRRSGAVVMSSGDASDAVFAIGGLRKGLLWESVAVPELRQQAAALARHVTDLASNSV